MPNDGGRTESNYAAGLLESPAKINIVTGFVLFRVEAADIFKGPSIKRHVTARDVLGDCVGD